MTALSHNQPDNRSVRWNATTAQKPGEAAGTVLVFGVAASGFVAADLHLKFERIGRSVYLATDPHLALMKTALLGPGDVAVGISHTGETVEVIDMLAEARSRGRSPWR